MDPLDSWEVPQRERMMGVYPSEQHKLVLEERVQLAIAGNKQTSLGKIGVLKVMSTKTFLHCLVVHA